MNHTGAQQDKSSLGERERYQLDMHTGWKHTQQKQQLFIMDKRGYQSQSHHNFFHKNQPRFNHKHTESANSGINTDQEGRKS
jgi:hypothetical protein